MTKEQGGEVHLLYSCNGSGRFVGVAKMSSPLDEKNSFMYWTQDSKWPGLFDIEWVFIKDTPFRAFKNIDIMMKYSLFCNYPGTDKSSQLPTLGILKKSPLRKAK